jgi:hypothetical protein
MAVNGPEITEAAPILPGAKVITVWVSFARLAERLSAGALEGSLNIQGSVFAPSLDVGRSVLDIGCFGQGFAGQSTDAIGNRYQRLVEAAGGGKARALVASAASRFWRARA